jgi:hypothetical protein
MHELVRRLVRRDGGDFRVPVEEVTNYVRRLQFSFRVRVMMLRERCTS